MKARSRCSAGSLCLCVEDGRDEEIDEQVDDGEEEREEDGVGVSLFQK